MGIIGVESQITRLGFFLCNRGAVGALRGNAADQIPDFPRQVSVELLSNVTVTLDGKLAIQNATVLLYDDVPYVPVRMAASFCGFEVAVGELGWAYLRTPLTEGQKQEMAAYVSAIQNLWKELDMQRYQIDTDDVNIYHRELPKLTNILERIEMLARPHCALLQYGYSEIDASMADIQTRLDGVQKGLAAGASMYEMQQKYISKRINGSIVDRPNWEGIMCAGIDMGRVLYQK